MKRLGILIASMLLLVSCGSTTQMIQKKGSADFNRMMKRIDDLVQDEAFAHAHWGVMAFTFRVMVPVW